MESIGAAHSRMPAASCRDVGIYGSSSEVVFKDEAVGSATVGLIGGTMVTSGEEGMSTGTFLLDVAREVVVVEAKYWSISNFGFLAEGCVMLHPVISVTELLWGLSRL